MVKNPIRAKTFQIRLCSLVLLLIVVGNASPSFACQGFGCQGSAHASVTQVVKASIGITRISNLDFGTAVTGDAEKIIEPGRTEDPNNASFAVHGHPLTEFRIIMPDSIFLDNENGRGRLLVNQFRSYPANTGRLNHFGRSELYVGATRQAIPLNAALGSYHGHFTITVAY